MTFGFALLLLGMLAVRAGYKGNTLLQEMKDLVGPPDKKAGDVAVGPGEAAYNASMDKAEAIMTELFSTSGKPTGTGGTLGTGGITLGKAEEIARRFGLSVSSGFRPGDDGCHGQNKARDFSGGSKDAMMRFAKFMVENYGKELGELIYTPLGYSIDKGNKTSPIAASDHYDHVHVAIGCG
jgi:hypothetical protein